MWPGPVSLASLIVVISTASLTLNIAHLVGKGGSFFFLDNGARQLVSDTSPKALVAF